MELNEASPKFKEASIAPMHTCEHIVNQTMIRLFGCGRSVEAHIERKKSKLDYLLPQAPTPEQVAQLEQAVNEVHRGVHPPSRSPRPLRPAPPAG